MTRCPEPDYVWPDCPVDDLTDAQIATVTAPATIAAALQKAAVDLLGLGDCEAHKDGGVVWGRPVIDDNCCGQVRTGVVTPVLVDRDGCVTIHDLEWHVAVSWRGGQQSVATQIAEYGTVSLLLAELACCLLADPASGSPAAKLWVSGEDSAAGDCEQVVYIVKAAR